MPGPILVVVLCLFLSSSTDGQVSSDVVTASGPALPSHEAHQDDHTVSVREASGIDGRQSDTLETTAQLAPTASVASVNDVLDIGSVTTIEGTTTAAVSPMMTTDTIEFRVLVGLSCRWLDGNGVERRSRRVCPPQSSCDLGPMTFVKKSGLDQRLYFCTGEQHLLVSMACRLEDTDRVVVLPRCKAQSRCSIGPLALSYGGRQVRGYFCDAQMLPQPSSSDWTDRGSAAEDTWTASGRSRLDRSHRQQGPRRSSDLPTSDGRKSKIDNDDVEDSDRIRDGKDDGGDHGNDHGKDHDASDDDDDHVHYGRHDQEGGRYTMTTESLGETIISTTIETPTAQTFDGKRFPGTAA